LPHFEEDYDAELVVSCTFGLQGSMQWSPGGDCFLGVPCNQQSQGLLYYYYYIYVSPRYVEHWRRKDGVQLVLVCGVSMHRGCLSSRTEGRRILMAHVNNQDFIYVIYVLHLNYLGIGLVPQMHVGIHARKGLERNQRSTQGKRMWIHNGFFFFLLFGRTRMIWAWERVHKKKNVSTGFFSFFCSGELEFDLST
jgi:hypothetical protein